MTLTDRDKLARECCEENRPRLLHTIEAIQRAIADDNCKRANDKRSKEAEAA